MQLTIQPTTAFQQSVTPLAGQVLPQASSPYAGTPHAMVGNPVQPVNQAQQQAVDNAMRASPSHQGGVVLGQQSPYLQGGMVTEHLVHPTGAEDEKAYRINTDPLPAVSTARLEISTGFTKNLGDYQTFRATVSVQLPWPADDVQRGLDECQRIAMERMQQLWARG